MAHFDVDGLVAPHVRRNVKALADATDRLIVVSTAGLADESLRWLQARSEVVQRTNFGYDFMSWRDGISAAGDLGGYDEVVICNDSYVGPLQPYSSIFTAMEQKDVDYWGLTCSQRVAPHVQSFFVVFREWVVASAAFRGFWDRMVPISDRWQVIQRYEVGLSLRLHSAGFRSGSYFVPNAGDVTVARRRTAWWAEHRPLRGSGRRPPRSVIMERAAEPWNPSIALADRALDGRLPFVKIDTLRYDPYGLGADALLRKCERRFPNEFSGVREFLDRTGPRYPTRTNERLLSTPLWAWTKWPRVRY